MDLLVGHGDGLWRARCGALSWRCAVGRGGARRDKREGDGATPVGRWPLRRVLYRPDRLEAPACALPVDPLKPDDGWCDAPDDPRYNRPVTLPYPARHERLWREDALYDIVVVLGHNDDPPRAAAGSAVFLHLATPDYGPTEGCVALAREDLLTYLRLAEPTSAIEVTESD